MALSDLDALIGELRREAARRRAAPDFPVDEEARLALEMDRQGPSGGTADLGAVLEALRALSAGSPPGPDRGEVAQLADLAGSALRALSARVGDLERRVGRLAPAGPGTAGPVPGDAGDPVVALDHWDRAVIDLATTVAGPAAAGPGGGRPGRIMVAGPGAGRWTDLLAAQGLDVYGVDPTGARYSDSGPVRAGGVAAHLQTVGEGALVLAVLVGPLAAAELPHLGRWASALAVRASTVMVVSEAPWAWRLRLGDPAADTSAWRPVNPETWLSVLDAAGYRLSGRYGPDGREFLLAGRVGPAAGGAAAGGPAR